MKKQLTNQLSAMYGRALMLKQQGNSKAAFHACEEVIKSYPKQYDCLVLMGIILSENNQNILALDFLNRAIAVKKDATAYNNRGNVYQGLKQFELALDDYEKAIKLDKKFVEAYYNTGNTYKEMYQYETAIEWYKKAVMVNPRYFTAYCNMAMCYQNLQRFEDALEASEKAIAIEPRHHAAYNNKGFSLDILGRYEESIAAFKKGEELCPENNDIKFNIGFVYLGIGDWENGWQAHEMRWNNKYAPPKLPNIWKGEDVYGKTIYIIHEQGLGDTIQFIRYVKHLKRDGAKKIIVSVKPEAAALIESMSEVDQVVILGKNVVVPDYDYYCPVMSLPYIYKTRPNNIPYEPYIKADAKKVHEFSMKMGNKNNKLRVGLVWNGGFRKDQPEVWAINERRNIPLEKLACLRDLNVQFYSLQMESQDKWPEMIDLMGEVKDFTDTAAMIENLDLVIAVDTSTAHVAGAMGKKVWLMNRHDSCWRWLREGTTTGWYPSFTIYRQNKFNTWDNVVEDIKRDLTILSQE